MSGVITAKDEAEDPSRSQAMFREKWQLEAIEPVNQLMTVKEAAALLACSEAAIRKWIYQGRLRQVKVGKLTRLRQSDIEALVSDGLGNR